MEAPQTAPRCRPQAHESDTPATYSPEGVDLTLIRWMLSLTPTQRLEILQAHVDMITKLRGGDEEA